MKRLLFVLLALAMSICTYAQSVQVSGKVNDTYGDPAVGASVSEMGTSNGTLVDIDGNFTLTLANPNAKIEVKFIGYTSQTINANGKTTFNIVLDEDAQILDEVVVTGYSGTQLRSKMTNSISKVKPEALTGGIFGNPAQALSGAIPGVRVINNSGAPGAEPTIILRGGTNLDGTGSPLIIIDGQIRANMKDINPSDIESMEVLKDAGATALYGARASNGVVLITTKTGKSGRAEIKVSAKMALNYLNMPYNFMGAEDYIRTMRQAYYDSANLFQDSTGKWKGYGNLTSVDGAQPFGTGNEYGVSPWSTMYKTSENEWLLGRGWQEMTDPLNPDKSIIFKDTNIRGNNFNTPSLAQDYNVSMSGGNDKGSYYAGLGYNHTEGQPMDTYYKRYSFLLNGDYKITNWLKSISNFSFNRSNWQDGIGKNGHGNYFGRIMSTPPTVRYEDEDGNALLGPHVADGNQNYQTDKFKQFNETDKFTMNQAVQIDLADGLFVKASMNWYYEMAWNEAFTKDYEITPDKFDRTRESKATSDRKFDQTYNAVINYSKRLYDDHNVGALAGIEYYDQFYRRIHARGEGAPTDDFGSLNLTSTDANKRTTESSHSNYRIMSYFGRLNYDYKDKYLISFVFRNDGYSSLLGDNRWGFFPGVSGGWIFSRESFMEPFKKWLSFGKLRASYGVNGNASDIKAYTLQGKYNTTAYNGNTGYLIGELPNAGLRWEKTRTFEIGADLNFFDNRLTTGFTYYNRMTSDKYADLSFPTSTGFSTIKNNNGELRNKGVEIELSGTILNQKDWAWTASANIAYNINKIISLPDNGLERNRQEAFEVYTGRTLDDGTYEKKWVGGRQAGQEPGMMYRYGAEGIYKSYDEIPGDLMVKTNGAYGQTLHGPDSWNRLSDAEKDAKKNFPIQPGDVRWKDVNGDGIIDEFDKVKIGNTVPRWTGGFNTTVSWKGISLYARMDYALGFHLYDGQSPWFLGAMQGTFNGTTDVLNTWSESNPNAKYPRYMWADQNGKANYNMQSTLFSYRGDYLAFREVSLSYSLPKEWVKPLKLSKLDVSVTGQNLGYWTSCKNIASPEIAAGKNAGSGYALPRTLLFGLDITF